MSRFTCAFRILLALGLACCNGCNNNSQPLSKTGVQPQVQKDAQAMVPKDAQVAVQKDAQATVQKDSKAAVQQDAQVPVQYEGANENWFLEYQQIPNHPEADLLVRYGSINNLGFGWPKGFNPFSGQSTPPHPFPWPLNKPTFNAAPGTDRILVVSSYRRSPPAGTDGYTSTTDGLPRQYTWPVPIPIRFAPPKFPIQSAVLQLFIDDFQSPRWKSKFLVVMNGWRVPELEAIINSVDQHGPIGKLITYRLPSEIVKTLDNGYLIIWVDDPITGAGDGFAFDFFRLLINPRASKYRGTLTGTVTNDADGKPIAEISVSAGGVVTTQTMLDGTFKLENVPAGLATLTFSGKGYQRKTTSIDLLAATMQKVDARLKAAKVEAFLQDEAAFQPRMVVPISDQKKKTNEERGKDLELRMAIDAESDARRVSEKESKQKARGTDSGATRGR